VRMRLVHARLAKVNHRQARFPIRSCESLLDSFAGLFQVVSVMLERDAVLPQKLLHLFANHDCRAVSKYTMSSRRGEPRSTSRSNPLSTPAIRSRYFSINDWRSPCSLCRSAFANLQRQNAFSLSTLFAPQGHCATVRHEREATYSTGKRRRQKSSLAPNWICLGSSWPCTLPKVGVLISLPTIV
jgi:hypothetical protein